MRIISTFLQPVAGIIDGRKSMLMVFDTLVGEKQMTIGITVGKAVSQRLEDVQCSPVGHEIIDLMADHMERNTPDGIFIVAGVARRLTAPERIRQVLKRAPDRSGVLLLCADDKVYDAAFPALNIDFQSAHQDPQ